MIAENVYDAENEQRSGGERLVTKLLLMPQHGAGYNIGAVVALAPTEDGIWSAWLNALPLEATKGGHR